MSTSLDPHNQCIYIHIMEKQKGMKVAETRITHKSLLKKTSPLIGSHKEDELLITLFKSISEAAVVNVKWEEKTLEANHK